MIRTKNKLFILLTIPLALFAEKEDEEKILTLKKRLASEILILEQKKVQVESLKKQISLLEFSQIKKKVEEVERKVNSYTSLPLSYQKEGAHFFLKERHILTERLEQDPDDLVAQNLLDRILRLITVLNRNSHND